ncbi:MAG: RpiB/LacA/LacB family sugar-phosphate isomerase [Thaumarchaeota archaeon]|nr:RpiB/LacA/LacB family sugar-phosphate isomerase [Nitrososphaerota archaeon]
MKKIYISGDHAGFKLKGKLKPWLEKKGFTVRDFGPQKYNPKDDYPDFVIPMVLALVKDKNKVKDFDYNLYIDDDPLLAKDADSENKNCFVYDQKWNSHVETSQYVSRINKLTDAIDNLSKKEL